MPTPAGYPPSTVSPRQTQHPLTCEISNYSTRPASRRTYQPFVAILPYSVERATPNLPASDGSSSAVRSVALRKWGQFCIYCCSIVHCYQVHRGPFFLTSALFIHRSFLLLICYYIGLYAQKLWLLDGSEMARRRGFYFTYFLSPSLACRIFD